MLIVIFIQKKFQFNSNFYKSKKNIIKKIFKFKLNKKFKFHYLLKKFCIFS